MNKQHRPRTSTAPRLRMITLAVAIGMGASLLLLVAGDARAAIGRIWDGDAGSAFNAPAAELPQSGSGTVPAVRPSSVPASSPGAGRTIGTGDGDGSNESSSAPCPAAGLACQAADEFARHLRFSDFDSMFASVEATRVACPGPGGSPADPRNPLCAGAAVGELRSGFPMALDPGVSVTVNGAEFRERIKLVVGDPTRLRLASIGCDESPGCDRFVVVFATGATPRVVYFAFNARLVPGAPRSARLSGFGLRGDNAPDMLSLEPAQTTIGPTTFVRYTGTR